MLSYETAVKLKEAGFPRRKIGCKDCEYAEFYDEDGSCWNTIQIEMTEDSIYIPSLSELIEACGSEFFELRYGYNSVNPYWISVQRGFENMAIISISPEEAVASLWFTIHKK